MVLIRPEDYAGDNADNISQVSYSVKTPKRVLQFSDGVLEEYSTDEEEQEENKKTEIISAADNLPWSTWLFYKALSAGNSFLSVIDYCGDHLAWFFGITTPRYYFELEEYKRRQELEKKQAEKEKGWCDNKETVQIDEPSTSGFLTKPKENIEV
ncbi:protein FAM177B [Sitophilus oryzae]|uniref:Protein FAM177B n=1 Tax=Sitophilus oryzae TaxID=7048 RepID=A0A6J2Y5R9_SITOR|nr:protein FAM177B [Sitophilus oryzae]XP_030758336.1 protein FAM177B [Sitophilus oryzae]